MIQHNIGFYALKLPQRVPFKVKYATKNKLYSKFMIRVENFGNLVLGS